MSFEKGKPGNTEHLNRKQEPDKLYKPPKILNMHSSDTKQPASLSSFWHFQAIIWPPDSPDSKLCN